MNCDRLAPWYRLLEYGALGRALERRRTEFLEQVGDCRRALLLGDGDGRFAAALVTRHREVRVVSVEQSAGMLRCARRRLDALPIAAAERAQFLQADVGAWLRSPPMASPESQAPFDLVATHFFFDCFSAADLAPLIAAIAARTSPGACWLVSEFRQPAGRGWPAWHAWVWLRVLYAFFRMATGLRVARLADHRPLLAAQGFVLEREITARAGMLVSELWRRR
ncbi:MAG: class I SAM-dependent methyltransferase [Verrucomicrobia bacterium]|nr:class I SAM-dependent methyltransferase [Verrucomicrobiota bacterium]MBV9659328.1 class I SAM-dependent methyltransferase [Verrucomicrobiota bacterium]